MIPELTVAICTYNREKYLPQVLGSILTQTLCVSKFEVLLINNNSPGNTAEISTNFAKNHPEVDFHYFLETNQGLSHARNRAIKESKGKYITFLDDDAFIDDHYLEVLLNSFNADENLAAIGGKILLHYESIIPRWENNYLNSLLGFYDKGDNQFYYTKVSNDYPRGSNMAFRNSLFDQVGMFDVTLGRVGGNLMGGEEKEMFDRIYQNPKNKVAYLPNALVWHSVPIERTTREFIIIQAKGTGRSERLRTLSQGKITFVKRCGIEFLKWGASAILWWIFLFKGQTAKGNMLLVFRWWVTVGLLKKKV